MGIFDTIESNTFHPLDIAFGEYVTFAPPTGDATVVRAVFVSAADELSMAGDVPIETTSPAFDVRSDVFTSRPLVGSTITRESGKTYRVRAIFEELYHYRLFVFEVTA